MRRSVSLLAACATTLLLGACASTPASAPAGLKVAVDPSPTRPAKPRSGGTAAALPRPPTARCPARPRTSSCSSATAPDHRGLAHLRGPAQGSGEENLLSWERFPATAFSKTYNTDSQTPDSAGTMTAITTGVKTHMGAIGVSAGSRTDCADSLSKGLLTWLQLADSAGLATGVVSTARLTHATPAATYAHSPERNWENDTDLTEAAKAAGCKDIAQQLLSTSRYGRGPLVALGGGRGIHHRGRARPGYDDKVGQRLDGRSLVQEWQQAHPHGAYVWNSKQLVRRRQRTGDPRPV